MPCPFFEPLLPATQPKYVVARLPLIEEYDGVCRAASEPSRVPDDARFAYCNHGYSQRECRMFPAGEARSAYRYSITRRGAEVLELICVEECDHTPARWFPLQYQIAESAVSGASLNECMKAQARAFCVSYLKKTDRTPQ